MPHFHYTVRAATLCGKNNGANVASQQNQSRNESERHRGKTSENGTYPVLHTQFGVKNLFPINMSFLVPLRLEGVQKQLSFY